MDHFDSGHHKRGSIITVHQPASTLIGRFYSITSGPLLHIIMLMPPFYKTSPTTRHNTTQQNRSLPLPYVIIQLYHPGVIDSGQKNYSVICQLLSSLFSSLLFLVKFNSTCNLLFRIQFLIRLLPGCWVLFSEIQWLWPKNWKKLLSSYGILWNRGTELIINYKSIIKRKDAAFITAER